MDNLRSIAIYQLDGKLGVNLGTICGIPCRAEVVWHEHTSPYIPPAESILELVDEALTKLKQDMGD